jgi:hypothetical protein
MDGIRLRAGTTVVFQGWRFSAGGIVLLPRLKENSAESKPVPFKVCPLHTGSQDAGSCESQAVGAPIYMLKLIIFVLQYTILVLHHAVSHLVVWPASPDSGQHITDKLEGALSQ